MKYYQWNCKCGRTASSNRTFMELKYKKAFDNYVKDGCSNRTFMELKWSRQLKMSFKTLF